MGNNMENDDLNHRSTWPELYDPDFPEHYEIINSTQTTITEHKATPLQFKHNDGGRLNAGFIGQSVRDCVARSISIASGIPYKDVYLELAKGNVSQRATSKVRRRTKSASKGIFTKRKWFRDYMASIGFTWVPTQQFGSGKRVYLREGDLPNGKLIVAVSKHYTAVINGVINDTFDCGHCGNRCVYGYWMKK
jgi:hypothetical protein